MINVSSEDAKDGTSRRAHKKANRFRSNSLVMRQRMQKKIAESAKERVLDKRKSQRSSLNLVYEQAEFRNAKRNDSLDDAKFDFRANDQSRNGITKHMSIDQPIVVINRHSAQRSSSTQRPDEAAASPNESDSIDQSTSEEKEINSKFNDRNRLVHNSQLLTSKQLHRCFVCLA